MLATEHRVSSEFRVAQPIANDAYFASFADWLAETGNRGRGRAELSIKAHLQDMRVFSRWFEFSSGQKFAPELVTSRDLRAFYHHSIEEKHEKPATWNRRRVTLNLFCEWAVSTGRMTYSPFQGVPIQEEESQPPHWLNQSDYARFTRRVEQATNTAKTEHARRLAVRDQAMIALMIDGGLRVGEVAELTVSDLLLSDRKGRVTIRNGKGGKTRSVPLGREARRAVNAWLETSAVSGEAMLFEGISARQVERIVKARGLEANVKVTPHQLRHTMLKRFMDSTQDIAAAQQLAGHSRTDTTMRYIKPGWEDLERAVENL